MPELQQLEQIFEVIEGGVEKAAGEIVRFPVDKLPAGEQLLEGVSETVNLGNGAASEISQLTVVETGATEATTAGLGLMAFDYGVAGAMAAPILGIVSGFALYDIAPEFWDTVAQNLIDAGETIGGKVRGFLNAETGQVGFTETVLNIFKNAFIDFGFYQEYEVPSLPSTYLNVTYQSIQYGDTRTIRIYESGYETFTKHVDKGYVEYLDAQTSETHYASLLEIYDGSTLVDTIAANFILNPTIDGSVKELWGILETSVELASNYTYTLLNELGETLAMGFNLNGYLYDNKYYIAFNGLINTIEGVIQNFDLSAFDDCFDDSTTSAAQQCLPMLLNEVNEIIIKDPPILPESVPPSRTDPIPVTYPDYQPWTIPQELPLPDIYPVEVPAINDNPSQQEAQNPEPIPDSPTIPGVKPSIVIDWLLDNFPIPDPLPEPVPQPQPVPEPDPDPQPEPEPIPVPEVVPAPADPIQPTPIIPIPTPVPIPSMPATVDSNALFTVYNPTISQLNSLGGWLWSTSIIDILMRMWQSPLEGIITLQKVYANPTTGSSRHIILGYLDSEVSAKVVTNQFATIDCGTISVPELKNNATDYPPYVSASLFLPFIGVVELDVTDFMNGSISVTYHVDMYTGTCLAEVKSTRAADMPSPTILYTFSGNASQQLPLTSSNFNGAISSLVSAVSGGIAIASGGALGAVAGLAQVGHSLTHEMIHVNRSGSLSANAGLMGGKKPFLIVSRRANYDANNYAEMYGFPSNKTVYLGNCSGFTRVKAGKLNSLATDEEKEEIYSLLKSGVFF